MKDTDNVLELERLVKAQHAYLERWRYWGAMVEKLEPFMVSYMAKEKHLLLELEAGHTDSPQFIERACALATEWWRTVTLIDPTAVHYLEVTT